jgi:hypothetical protein
VHAAYADHEPKTTPRAATHLIDTSDIPRGRSGTCAAPERFAGFS